MIMTGAAAPSVDPSVKYAGSAEPSKGTVTLLVAGSIRSNDFWMRSRPCW
jgi:hypothetical protein